MHKSSRYGNLGTATRNLGNRTRNPGNHSRHPDDHAPDLGAEAVDPPEPDGSVDALDLLLFARQRFLD
jgi:hypothetical protein